MNVIVDFYHKVIERTRWPYLGGIRKSPIQGPLKKYNTLVEYQKDAQRVMTLDKDKFKLLRDSGVGLVTEVAEVVDVFKRHWTYKTPLDLDHMKKEIGDVLWYAAQGHYSMNMDLADFDLPDFDPSNFYSANPIYPSLDMILAKMVRYSSNIMSCTFAYPENGLNNGMEHDLRELVSALFWLSYRMGFDLYEIAAMQTRKMEIRYPNGFDPVKGNHANRNLKAEASI